MTFETITTEKADLSGTQAQITADVYGSDTGVSSPDIHSNDLLRVVITGVSTSQLSSLVSDVSSGSTSGLDVVEYENDRQGGVVQMIDQNGTEHVYGLDGLGREVSDTATTLGTGVDGAVRRIDTAYNFQGSVDLTTSYDATSGGSVVNQVEDIYNSFGLVTDEYQAVSGAVDTSTTPDVQYAYADGTATPTRLVGMTYPNGRELTYGYNSGADAAVGRVSDLADSDSTQLVDYYYLGLSQIDGVSNPEPGITLDLGHKDSDGNLDRTDQFNRATDMIFAETGGDIEKILQGYDVSGNELWQAQPTAASNGVYLDNLDTYNALDEVTSVTQGTLNSGDTAITSNEDQSQSWSLDGRGNWANFTQVVSGSTALDQNRSTNSLNQITSIGSSWAVPGYDAAGNMTTMPQPGNETTGLTNVFDAWQRLVEVENGSTVISTYSYDGFNHRVTETAGGHTTAYYFDTSDQVLEERIDGSTSASLQYVWGLRNVNDLVLRDSNNGTGGSLGISGSGLGLRLYALQDANWNVVALVDTSGVVQERFTYTAYGTATAMNADFSAFSGSSLGWTVLSAVRDLDTATGLYYNNARWYNPSLGTFITTDPANADLNTYRYAGNNPIVLNDPNGTVTLVSAPGWDLLQPGVQQALLQVVKNIPQQQSTSNGIPAPQISLPGLLGEGQLMEFSNDGFGDDLGDPSDIMGPPAEPWKPRTLSPFDGSLDDLLPKTRKQ